MKATVAGRILETFGQPAAVTQPSKRTFDTPPRGRTLNPFHLIRSLTISIESLGQDHPRSATKLRALPLRQLGSTP
jgi:hypothetical protein